MTLAQREYFDTVVNSLLESENVQLMDSFVQHGTVTCLAHCLAVAWISYRIACRLRLRLDMQALIRGAMLHDYFLYDWHDKDKGIRWHGFRHPGIAAKNARKDFSLNLIEADIILKHMWPLTLVPPVFTESIIVCIADKYCSILETAAGFKFKLIG